MTLETREGFAKNFAKHRRWRSQASFASRQSWIRHLSCIAQLNPMRVALIAPPFIAVPPKKYGGTELFIAELALGLQQEGVEVVVYTIGESTVNVPKKWRYEKENWPVCGDPETNL